MKRFLPHGLIFAGLLGVAGASGNTDSDLSKSRKKLDLRETILRKFLSDKHCPDQDYAEVFVAEADAHGLDWRLLPSLALIESGGGRNAKGNNLFGWANGKVAFASIGEAIHQVASALAHGRSYRGKSLDAKLAAYNNAIDYRDMVRAIMSQIASAPELQAAE